MRIIVIFLMIFIKLAIAEAPAFVNLWVVWNIGQGQWVTHISSDECRHFDVGGEPGTFKRIRAKLISNCGRKKNLIYLSHWHMDHYLHIPFIARALPKLCWQYQPGYGIKKSYVQKILQLNLTECTPDLSAMLWSPTNPRTTNESSAIFIFDSVLLPGDSHSPQEKIWSLNHSKLIGIKVLILGHHGSRSSSGEELLERLPNLKWSVASARWVKYRHPHQETLKRLYQKNIPILRTEDWGNIWFQN